jgi:outer membrane protein OmpA-like peptidoglycan-associated protein
MKMALGILFAATILWFVGATQWYVCNIQYLCSKPAATQTAATQTDKKSPSIFQQVFGVGDEAISEDAATTKEPFEKTIAHFFPDSTEFIDEEEAQNATSKIVEYARMNPNKTFLITGYTADVGPYYGDCDWMSRVRAERMRDVLVQAGVEESRIQTQGLAAQNPVGDNSTPEGMAANRRVEVEVVK